MEDKTIKEVMSLMGRKGGKSNLTKYGKEYFSEIGKLGMEKRWGKLSNKQKDGSRAK